MDAITDASRIRSIHGKKNHPHAIPMIIYRHNRKNSIKVKFIKQRIRMTSALYICQRQYFYLFFLSFLSYNPTLFEYNIHIYAFAH
jgi:hypothetical protein